LIIGYVDGKNLPKVLSTLQLDQSVILERKKNLWRLKARKVPSDLG